MKKNLISLALMLLSGAAFCNIVTVATSGFTFSPSTITINAGDTVNFVIASIHDVVEVSQATYAAGGNAPLSGGFSTPYGGGMVYPAQLAVGTHWYVCEPHASMGMKGRIIVQSATGIATSELTELISVYPAVASSKVTVRVSEGIHGTLQFIDVEGKVLEDTEINQGELRLYVGDMPKGIYFIRIIDDNGNTVVKRIVKP